jgi:hypothetical protein
MSLWRKRNVHHSEQNQPKWFNMTALANNDLSIQSDDLSIKSKKTEEDDDIQVYKKPWVGLTEEDIKLFDLGNYIYVVRIVEARLKELNA